MDRNENPSTFCGCPILVVGDVMLDEFVWGHVTRISPEAPVPVVEVRRETTALGGAANTAANLAGLGAAVAVVGLVGADAAGDRIADLLDERQIERGGLVRLAGHTTTTKTRILAQGQQVVRIDRDPSRPPGEAGCRHLRDRLRDHVRRVRGCVVSDYGKGVVTAALVAELADHCRAASIPLVVDPKGVDYAKYRGATLVKPNLHEAELALSRPIRNRTELEQAGRQLVETLGSRTAVLITQGADGMTLFQHGRASVTVEATAQEVYDVTGAGDTVAATMTVALAVGWQLETACRLASTAAAAVVGRLGTSPVESADLKSLLP